MVEQSQRSEIEVREIDAAGAIVDSQRFETTQRMQETVDTGDGAKTHELALNPAAAPVYPQNVRAFPGRENCDYNEHGFTCRVAELFA